MNDFPKLKYQGSTYLIVPAPVADECWGCVFRVGPCPSQDHSHKCHDYHNNKTTYDTVLIHDTPEAVANWVLTRMNGATEEDDA